MLSANLQQWMINHVFKISEILKKCKWKKFIMKPIGVSSRIKKINKIYLLYLVKHIWSEKNIKTIVTMYKISKYKQSNKKF